MKKDTGLQTFQYFIMAGSQIPNNVLFSTRDLTGGLCKVHTSVKSLVILLTAQAYSQLRCSMQPCQQNTCCMLWWCWRQPEVFLTYLWVELLGIYRSPWTTCYVPGVRLKREKGPDGLGKVLGSSPSLPEQPKNACKLPPPHSQPTPAAALLGLAQPRPLCGKRADLSPLCNGSSKMAWQGRNGVNITQILLCLLSCHFLQVEKGCLSPMCSAILNIFLESRVDVHDTTNEGMN